MAISKGLLAILAGVAFINAAQAVEAQAIKPGIVPGRFIIEYEDQMTEQSLMKDLTANEINNWKTQMTFSYSLFKGVSIQLPNITEQNHGETQAHIARLSKLPSVKNVWPVEIFQRPKPKVLWVGSSPDSVLPEGSATQGVENDTFSTHIMTQVDRLHAEGLTGKGIRVSIIDDGIDYTHPDLGGCFGPNCLVFRGKDFLGNTSDIFNPIPDDDPYTNCSGHGTHVAGIIAAQQNRYGFTGAAPGVKLSMYRALSCGGSGSNEMITAAFNQAYDDGSDVITASIGASSGWSAGIMAEMVSRIVQKGVICTVAAGNSGSSGLFTADMPGSGNGVIAVGSVDNTQIPYLAQNATYRINNGTENHEFAWRYGTPSNWENRTFPLYTVSYDLNDTRHGCYNYPANTPNLTDYIVLIAGYGFPCSLSYEAQFAALKGAKHMLFAMPNGLESMPELDYNFNDIQGIGGITFEQGQMFAERLKAGDNVYITITDPRSTPLWLNSPANPTTGGSMSYFTSWGPTFEMNQKPQIAAVGGNVLSLYIRSLGGYAILSGTSMATPQAAAIIALILEAKGKLSPAAIENLLSSTAKPLNYNDGTATKPYLAPVVQQGGGIIQAWNAVHASSILSVPSLAFNDSDHFIPTRTFSVKNTGTKDITYELSNRQAATVYTFGTGASNSTRQPFPVDLVQSSANVTFSSNQVTVLAGQEVEITVTLTPPADVDTSRLPIYSGYILLTSSDGQEVISLPYMGAAGRLYNALTFLTAWLSRTDQNPYYPVPANFTFTMQQTGSPTQAVEPWVTWRPNMGTRVVRVDAVPLWPGANTTDVLGIQALGPINYMPYYYDFPGDELLPWNYGKMADGSIAPAGRYKLVLRLLRLFGDEKKPEDYIKFETVEFTIQYPGNSTGAM